MKKIGKEVFFLKTGKGNPRNGEGSFIRLKDGRIMYAYTEYYGDDWVDEAIARVAAIYSSDEGESWSESRPLLEKDEDALNIMSISLLRMGNGDLGILYLRKSMRGDKMLCMPYFARSRDEGESFSSPVCCLQKDGYYVVNNDRFIRLQSGRVLFPFAFHGEDGAHLCAGKLSVCYSDDDGESFYTAKEFVCSPYDDVIQLQEPGVYELADGRLWMFCRTAYGHQYQCISKDGGESFGGVTPAFRFTSPDAPMQVREAHGYTLAVFNPLGYSCVSDTHEVWFSPKRSPFVLALSEDGGSSFADTLRVSANGAFRPFATACRLLEEDTQNSYCYPAIIETRNGVLIAYYHSDNTPVCFSALKITKVGLDELREIAWHE